MTGSIVVAKDVLVQELDGEAVILDLNTQHYYGLNAAGTRMWNLLLETGSITDTCKALHSEYDAPVDQLERDVRMLVEELTRRGLLVVPDLGRS